MTREEFIETYNLDEAIILDPASECDKGIIGVTDDNSQIVYGYVALANSLMEAFKKSDVEAGNEILTDEEYFSEACEWIETNTIPTIAHMNSPNRPIIIKEIIEELDGN